MITLAARPMQSDEERTDRTFIIRQQALWPLAEMADESCVGNSFMFRLELCKEVMLKDPDAMTLEQKKWMFNAINSLILENDQLRAKHNGLIVEVLRTKTERLNIGRDRLEIP